MKKANDHEGLLLLYVSTADVAGITALGQATAAAGKHNVAFICSLLLGKVDECLELLSKSGRIAEAAFMARTYAPSKIPDILHLWKKNLGQRHRKIADSLADPTQFPNLFPDYDLVRNKLLFLFLSFSWIFLLISFVLFQGLKAETLLKKERAVKVVDGTLEDFKDNIHRDVIGELKSQEDGGQEGVEEEEAVEEQEEEEEFEEAEEEALALSPKTSQVQQPRVSTRASLGNQDDDSQFDGSENFSMDANTAGTSSNKVDFFSSLSITLFLDPLTTVLSNEG